MAEAAIKHPDFIITVGGSDVTGDCLSWRITDNEESMSSLVAMLDNTDRKYDGKIQIGSDIAIRFGHFQNLSAKVELRILKKKEHNGVNGLTMTVTGLDATQKLSSKTGRGHQSGGTKVKENIDQIAKEAGVQIDHSNIKEQGEEPGPNNCARYPMLGGTPCDEQLQGLIDGAEATKEGQDSSGQVFDKSADGESGGGPGQKLTDNREAATGLRPADQAEKNRVKNANKRAKSTAIKGHLRLVGYPLLKAKECVTIVNVGTEGSGKWYVQNCTHSWSRGGGYRTEADLLRGSTGKGSCDAPQPMLFYGDIYKGKDNIYAGPRKSDAESQATLIFGDGSYIEEFGWEIDAQTGRGAGKQVEGKTVDPNKASEPVEDIESKTDEGAGGDQGANEEIPQI